MKGESKDDDLGKKSLHKITSQHETDKLSKTDMTMNIKEVPSVINVETEETAETSNDDEEEEKFNSDALEEFILNESLPFDCFSITLNEEELKSLFGVYSVEKYQRVQKEILEQKSEEEEAITVFGLSINKDKLLSLLDKELLDSQLKDYREQITDYLDDSIAFVTDFTQTFGGNFVIILSREVAHKLQSESLPEPKEVNADSVTLEEASDSVMFVHPKSKRTWMNQGSDKEIIAANFTETRQRIATVYQRPRREFGAPVNLEDSNIAKAYSEMKPYVDKSFDVPIIELERGVSCSNTTDEKFTNTEWRFPRNSVTQYVPRTFTPEELASILASKGPLKQLYNSLPIFEFGLKENIMYDFLHDDYGCLALGDDTYDTKASNTFKEFLSFSDLKFSKDKAVTHIQWHPQIKGLIAMSVGEHLTYDQRIDNSSRILMTPSYIMIWCFLDPIQPQLLLEAPEDILCFKFNPTDPHIVAGGCFNGLVVLWDISKYIEDLKNVKTKLKTKIKVPLFQFDDNDNPEVPIIPWSAISNIEASHATPITDIQWIPDHIEVSRLGYCYENVDLKCYQLMTCATEGGIFFWDTRPEKSPLAADKNRDAITPAVDVPLTYAPLDMKWKPLLRVTLFKKESGAEHCPTRFCIREVQGERQLLVSTANLKLKSTSSQAVTGSSAKLQTLENVNSYIYVGTEDGDLVYVDWLPQKDSDTGRMQTPLPEFFAQQHDGPISFIGRSPFIPSLVLLIGGWTWSLWKEGVNTFPILSSCGSSKPLTGGSWSPTRPSVFYIIHADGNLEVWDILDKTHEPTMRQSISASALTSIILDTKSKQQMIAIGDMNGILHILMVPRRLKSCAPTELENMEKYIEREVKRRNFVLNRMSRREQERIDAEKEKKRLVGISSAAPLTEEEQMAKMKIEYTQYLEEERAFLRQLGLLEEDLADS